MEGLVLEIHIANSYVTTGEDEEYRVQIRVQTSVRPNFGKLR
jgi:hypothetical protein